MAKLIVDKLREFTADDVSAIRDTVELFRDDGKVMKIHAINKAQLFAVLAMPQVGVSDIVIAVGLPKLNLKFYNTPESVCTLFGVDPKNI